jgi:integrase
MHVIQRILGHAQVTTTRIYTDPTDRRSRRTDLQGAMARWDKLQPQLQPEAGS